MPTVLAQGSETVSMSEPPHNVEYNTNPRTITWERLENNRLRKLGLGAERYSRHFQRFQGHPVAMPLPNRQPVAKERPDLPPVPQYTFVASPTGNKSNSVAPFSTVGKPTCGYFFSRQTDNKKKKIGIPATNLVKWRSFVQ